MPGSALISQSHSMLVSDEKMEAGLLKCHSDSSWWALTTARYSGGTTLPNVVRRGINLDVLQLGNLVSS